MAWTRVSTKAQANRYIATLEANVPHYVGKITPLDMDRLSREGGHFFLWENGSSSCCFAFKHRPKVKRYIPVIIHFGWKGMSGVSAARITRTKIVSQARSKGIRMIRCAKTPDSARIDVYRAELSTYIVREIVEPDGVSWVLGIPAVRS